MATKTKTFKVRDTTCLSFSRYYNEPFSTLVDAFAHVAQQIRDADPHDETECREFEIEAPCGGVIQIDASDVEFEDEDEDEDEDE